MKVFIAGASRVLGRSTIKQLIASGHEITGFIRSEKVRLVETPGVKPVIGDIFNPSRVCDLVGDANGVKDFITKNPKREVVL